MNKDILEKVFLKKSKEVISKGQLMSAAYRMYGYELWLREALEDDDISHIKKLVEDTSPVLEKIYQLQNDDGSVYFEDESHESIICDTAVFAAIMCLASRIYEELDPVFSRDIIHAALDAGHYLMIGQFRKGGSDNGKDENYDARVSIQDMGSKDQELSFSEKCAQMWAFAELLRTDPEIRNAYDHSMMAGMPQRMSRQKRYKIRFSELVEKCIKKESIEDPDNNTGFYYLFFSEIATIFDAGENAPENIASIFINDVFKRADICVNDAKRYNKNGMENANLNLFGIDLSLVMGVLCAEILLKRNLDEQRRDSDLIKVIEYNVINSTEKKLSDSEKDSLKKNIEKWSEKLEDN